MTRPGRVIAQQCYQSNFEQDVFDGWKNDEAHTRFYAAKTFNILHTLICKHIWKIWGDYRLKFLSHTLIVTFQEFSFGTYPLRRSLLSNTTSCNWLAVDINLIIFDVINFWFLNQMILWVIKFVAKFYRCSFLFSRLKQKLSSIDPT